MIDVGGPSMLRGAAKNFAHVAPVCRPEPVRLRARRAARERRALARDAARARRGGVRDDRRLRGRDRDVVHRTRGRSPTRSSSRSRRCSTSRTARTRTSAPRTTPSAAPAATSSRASSSCTARSSRSTTSTTSRRARSLAREFALPACVIVKHANPCGVAVGATIEEAYDKALASDPTSAYGGVVVLNREVDAPLGEKLAEQFVEVLFAPGYDDDALDALTAQEEHAHPPRRRAALRRARASATTSACSAACSSRIPTPRSRIARAGRS